MAVTATAVYLQQPNTWYGVVNNASGTGQVDLTSVGTEANGAKVESLIVTSTDTSARDLYIYLKISSTYYQIGTVSIPATSGIVNSVVTVDILRAANLPGLAYDASGNRVLNLAHGVTLSVAAGTAVTSGKQITVMASGGLY